MVMRRLHGLLIPPDQDGLALPTVVAQDVDALQTVQRLGLGRDWFDNDRRLKALVAELEELSITIVDQAEGWTTKS